MQCSFCINRRTVDMIFSDQQLQEKCREQNLPLYHCFIDLLKAFDTVNRSTHWKILKSSNFEKFVSLIQSLHDGMKARFGFRESLSDKIPVDNGIKQGDISATILFTIYFIVVFLWPSMKIRMMSTSDTKYLVKYTISIDCRHTQRSLPLW